VGFGEHNDTALFMSLITLLLLSSLSFTIVAIDLLFYIFNPFPLPLPKIFLSTMTDTKSCYINRTMNSKRLCISNIDLSFVSPSGKHNSHLYNTGKTAKCGRFQHCILQIVDNYRSVFIVECRQQRHCTNFRIWT
jgi:hypothetical protein